MLTVWTGIWGAAYEDRYLHKLRAGVGRHLSTPHDFRVLSDRAHMGYVTVKRTGIVWRQWWPKLWLFTVDFPGVNVWIDLDSVIVGSLDELIARHADDRLAMPANWAQSGHGGCQSSVMIWRGGGCTELFEAFDYERDTARLYGDQEFITERWGDPGQGGVTEIEHPAVCSYKYHARNGPPRGAKIVTFHGQPKPGDCPEPWVRDSW